MSDDDFDLDAGLKRLHLPTIRRQYPQLQQQAEREDWSYRDFLDRLVSEELAHRAEARILRATRKARAGRASAWPTRTEIRYGRRWPCTRSAGTAS